ncbi:glycerophosphoryl diester phosphodiesterase membrane domain-containing protein [Arthrobacter sp. AOP36-A1-22]|uniref:glycerophosphoryl diester phosphodiesterase membrane domain-containing protein n=1 Tax=unclassified Arthrobacter TaxID=235627 RepID=UPI00264CBBC7|nr:glycerophosphodiester phosphodiesterase [Micrococcaceae bacterium]
MLWQGIILVFVLPLVKFLFTHALALAGTPNLTDRNFPRILHSPPSVLLFLAIGFIALGALALQYTSVIALVGRIRAGSRHPGTTAGRQAWRATGKALGLQAPLVALYVFLLMPLGGLADLSPLTRDIGVAPFVTAEYLKKPLSISLYLSMISALVYLNLRLLPTIPLLVTRGLTPLRAMLTSWQATWTPRLRLPTILAAPLLAAVLTFDLPSRTVAWAATLPGAVLDTDSHLVTTLGLGAARAADFVLMVIATVALIRVLLAWVDRRVPAGRASASPAGAVDRPAAEASRSPGRAALPLGGRRLALRTTAGAAVVAIAIMGAPAVAAAPAQTSDPLVIAHRGWVWGGVENTLGALESAATQDPDLVEVDVQQTKDGHFVASHDTNLLLLTGHNVDIYDLTLAEAEATTVSARGFSDHIPSMLDYVRRARQLGIKLLIEPKVHGHETDDYLDRFIAELASVGPLDDNIYHSLDADLVESLKARRPDLSVGYTIAMTVGGIPDVNCDFLVVEQASYSKQFLDQARAADLPVYVWTVNREDRIRKYLYDGVAGIVTDHPQRARTQRSRVHAHPGTAFPLRDVVKHLASVMPTSH